MIEASIPLNESSRLKALNEYKILDTAEEESFDQIIRIASGILNMPVGMIGFTDENRQWLKSRIGIKVHEGPRNLSFCGHVVDQGKTLVVEDTQKDVRFHDNPYVSGSPYLRFYAGAPIKNQNGNTLGTLCVVDYKPRNLTECQVNMLESLANQVMVLLELRLANIKINERNNKLTTLLLNMSEGMVIQNNHGEITEFNPSSLKLLGLTENQILGKTSYDPMWMAISEDGSIIKSENHPSMITIRTGATIKNSIMGIHNPDGNLKWLSINSTPLVPLEDNTTTKEVLCTFTDVSELKNSEKKYKRIFENTPMGLLELNPDGTLNESNPAFQKMLGYSDSELKSKNIIELIHPDDIKKSKSNLELLEKTGISIKHFEKRYITKEGKIIWGKITSNPFKNTLTEKTEIFTAVEDITEQKKLELEFKIQEAKLLQSAKMSSLGEMAAGMAHEINNPLAIISGSASLMKKQLSSETNLENLRNPFMDRLNKIELTVDRISKIIRGLRSISRNGSQDPKIQSKTSQIIDETLSVCQEKFKINSILLQINNPQDPMVFCRPGQISQVLLNCLNNSFDAVHDLPTRWIKIDCVVRDQWLFLSVTDSGSGISPEDQNKLMQPFFTTKDVGKGTGLGLSISSGIIADHQGKFYYDSESPNTRFVMEIPLNGKQNPDS